MAQQNFADPAHRLENLAKGEFFVAYAILHSLVHDARWSDMPVSDIRQTCIVLDQGLAKRFDITMTSLRGALADVGADPVYDKSAKDEGGTATA